MAINKLLVSRLLLQNAFTPVKPNNLVGAYLTQTPLISFPIISVSLYFLTFSWEAVASLIKVCSSRVFAKVTLDTITSNINNNGKRVDIPVPSYKYDSGRSTLFGAWSEYNITVPFIQLKEAGVESIDGLSVIMSNPTTKIDGNYEPVLTQKEKKEISKVNAVYSFYLKLSK